MGELPLEAVAFRDRDHARLPVGTDHGEGQVLAVKPTGGDEEVTVLFARVGTKRLLASMARLEKI